MKTHSLNHQTGASAVRLNKSDPLTVGSSDHFDSVAQKRLPLGAELQLALNLIPAHTWYAIPSGGLTFVNQRCSDYLGLSKDHPLRFGIDIGAECVGPRIVAAGPILDGCPASEASHLRQTE